MNRPAIHSTLNRKLLRDLREGWKSFLAIGIICMLAVTVYVGIDTTWRCIDRDVTRQIQDGRLSSLWVQGAVQDRDVRNIEALSGVETVQRRLKLRSEAEQLPGVPRVDLIMHDGMPRVDLPVLLEGEWFQEGRKNQCILDQRFAAAYDLAAGDSITVSFDNHILELTITGLGNMAEYIATSNDGILSTDPSAYGHGVVSPGTLGFLPYTEIGVRLCDGAEEEEIKAQVEAMLGARQAVVITRNDVMGVKLAMEQAQQIRAMGLIFPLIFFLVAALITWTTMGRLVENQRLMIGSMRAMGYTRGELLWHYAAYGFVVSIAGSLFGLLGARFFLAELLMWFVSAVYMLPGAKILLDLPTVILICVVLCVITGGASMLSARKVLRKSPAHLLRPKPPSKGNRVFLENTRIWDRLQFSSKMILRNLLRNRIRLLMGLLGTIGCCTLLLTGFGMVDSTAMVQKSQYEEVKHYDARVLLKDDAPLGYGTVLSKASRAEAFEEEMIGGYEVLIQGVWQSKLFYILEDDSQMLRLWDEQGNPVSLPAKGVLLTVKAAEELELGIGDPLPLRVPGGRTAYAQVAGIIQLQLEQGVYLSRSAWEGIDIAPFAPTDILLTGPDLAMAKIADMDGVRRTLTIEEEKDSFAVMLRIMDIVAVVLVCFSGALAFTVFYNLGQLNLSERMREMATLKVLGFTQPETKKLVLRENIIMTCLGIPLGLLLGPLLLRAVLTFGLPNTIQFIPIITPANWALTVALTLGFSVLINQMLGTRLKTINMVEALKSVE